MDAVAEGQSVADAHYKDGSGYKGKKNAYECETCGSYIVTVDRDLGVTPFLTKCGNCGGTARSKMYRVADKLEPTHKWARPQTADGLSPPVIEHIRRGGLILSPINKKRAKWTLPPA